jgi:hypothetical protein
VASIERVRADAAAVRVALNLTYALAQPPYRVSIFPLIRPPFVPLGDFPLVFKVKLSGDAGKAVAAAVSSPSKPSRQRFLWVQAPSRCGSGAAILGNTLSTTYDHVVSSGCPATTSSLPETASHVGSRDPRDYAINVMCLPAITLLAAGQVRTIEPLFRGQHDAQLRNQRVRRVRCLAWAVHAGAERAGGGKEQAGDRLTCLNNI